MPTALKRAPKLNRYKRKVIGGRVELNCFDVNLNHKVQACLYLRKKLGVES